MRTHNPGGGYTRTIEKSKRFYELIDENNIKGTYKLSQDRLN